MASDQDPELAHTSQTFTHNQRYVLYTGSMVVVLGAVGALMKPVKASILGFPVMAAAIHYAKPAGEAELVRFPPF